jgi:ubiquinone/menaquinone biosynthesis C-methylase UbiE
MSEEQPTSTRDADARDHYSKSVDSATWWHAHFDQAAGEIAEFLGGDGISLEGMRVADIGCGDGIIDLGVMLNFKPAQLVGFDVQATDVDALAARAATAANIQSLPAELYFATAEQTRLPAESDYFDIAVSWSAFEHIADPCAVLREVRRVLSPNGVLFIQVWPFYASAHGTHLVDWYPSGFAQYLHDDDEITRTVRASEDQEMAAEMLEVYRTLNKITADELHAALRTSGFKVVKVALSAESVHIPDQAEHVPLSQVAISGIKLLAIPDPAAEPHTDDPPDAEAMTGEETAATTTAGPTTAATTTGAETGAVPGAPVAPAALEEPPARVSTVRSTVIQALRSGLSRLDRALAAKDQ